MNSKTCVIEPLELRQMMARNFYIGNSMTDGLSYSGLQDLFSVAGSITWGRQTRSGGTQGQNYYLDPTINTTGYDPARSSLTNPWGVWSAAFASQWDNLSVQPNERRFTNDLQVVNGVVRQEGEVPSTLRFMNQLATNSPNAQVYIYSRPARRTDIDEFGNPTGLTFDYSNRWNGTYYDSGPSINYEFYTRSSVTQLMPLMRKGQLADPVARNMPLVKLIPGGEVYYNIDQMLKAGKFAGTPVTSMLQFYADHTHPTTNLASYALALTFYATMTGNDPRGMGVPNAYSPTTGPLSNVVVTTNIQQAVYDAIHDTAYSNWTSAMPGDPAKPGSLTVKTFSDSNGNNQLDSGEINLSGMSVYLDLNNNTARDTNEPVAISDDAGLATFSYVSPGNYVVRSETPEGFATTSPAVNATVQSLKNSDANIGYVESQQLAGTSSLRVRVFTSRIGNGVIGENDVPLPSVRVYIRKVGSNLPGPFDQSLVTTSTGSVRFSGLVPGNYTAYVIGGPSAYSASFTLTAGATTDWKVGVNPLLAIAGRINVSVFSDTNRNGVKDASENASANITLFIDKDNDGRLDGDETSGTTDSLGNATFNSVATGNYVVRAVIPSNSYASGTSLRSVMVLSGASPAVSIGIATTPTGLPPSGVFSGTSVMSGYVVNDTNGDGKWSSGEVGIAGRTVWIDANNNGTRETTEPTATTASNGKYIFSNLAGGTYYVREVLPSGWVQNYPTANAAFKVVLGSGVTRAGLDFCVKASAARSQVVTQSKSKSVEINLIDMIGL